MYYSYFKYLTINIKYDNCVQTNVNFRIVWILGSNKTNRNIRTLEELLPNRDQDGYQPNPVSNRDTFTINIVSNKIIIIFPSVNQKKLHRTSIQNGSFQEVG